jgi:cysteine synthase A
MSKAEEEFVAAAINDKGGPVVVFALEWCEFCWSVKKLFKKLEIPYRSVDLDSVEFQEGQRGRTIRDVLKEQTAFETIPQIFIGGEFVGGCTDLFDGWNEGRVQRLLDDAGVKYNRVVEVDPYSFLPEWLHPR